MSARCGKCQQFVNMLIEAPQRFQPQGQWAAIQGEDHVYWCKRCVALDAESPEHQHQFVGEGKHRHCFHCEIPAPGTATTLWKCPSCGDVMPAGYGEDDHFNCNWPEDFEPVAQGTPDLPTTERQS